MSLLFLTLAAIALLLVLILAVRLHAFAAMLLTSMALGLAAGMPPAAVLKSIQNGFGEALGFIFVVLGLGAIIGAYLDHSGGGHVLANWLLKRFGRERAAWAILCAAYLVGPSDLLRGRLYYPRAAGLESGPRVEALPHTLRPAHGGGVDCDACAGAPASRPRGRLTLHSSFFF